jgi:hypothetical protein
MKPVSCELKSVTDSTSFSAVRVLDQGIEKYALIDQDSEIVGLVERDTPYYISGGFSEALVAAKRGLRSGACHRGYPCSPFGQLHYVLDKVLEPITDLSNIPEVRKAQDLANEAIALSMEIKARKSSDLPLLPNEKIVN